MVSAELQAGWRDASFLVRPGRAEVCHVAVDHPDGAGLVAACKSGHQWGNRHVIYLGEVQPARGIHLTRRCQRNGCKQRWPAYSDPTP